MAKRLLPDGFLPVLDSSGNTVSGAKIHTYETGTTTNKQTHQDAAGAAQHANPVLTGSNGYPTTNTLIWLDTDGAYTITVKDASDNTLHSEDGVRGVYDPLETGTVSFGGDIDLNGNDLIIDDGKTIQDDSNNEYIKFAKTASAINEISITNAAASAGPKISATGGDTNIDLDLEAKGTGAININATADSASEARLFEATGNGTNYFGIKAATALTASTTLTMPDGLGSSGQFLQTNGSGTGSWASANEGWVFIEAQTASASATIDFSTSIDNTYALYKVVLNDIVPATDGAELYMRTSTDGGSTFDSGAGAYDYTYSVTASHTTGVATFESASATFIQMADDLGSAAGEAYNGEVKIFNPSGTRNTFVTFQGIWRQSGADGLKANSGGAERTSAADVDGFRFLMSSGNIASGELRLYGLIKS